MAKKTQLYEYFDGTILANTTDLQNLPVVPNGKTVVLTAFGGSCPDTASYFAIQWGSGATWVTIRASYGSADMDMRKRVFVGNGVKRFRLVRANKSLSLPQSIVVWADGYINDNV